MEAQVAASEVHERWLVGDVADALGGQRDGAAVVQNEASRLRGVEEICPVWSRVRVDDAVVEQATPRLSLRFNLKTSGVLAVQRTQAAITHNFGPSRVVHPD